MTDPDARYKRVTLSRHQIERLAVFMALQRNVESVTIEETHESGIGAHHCAVYHCNKIEHDWQEDITDVGTW